jgi:hypothetical protein
MTGRSGFCKGFAHGLYRLGGLRHVSQAIEIRRQMGKRPISAFDGRSMDLS